MEGGGRQVLPAGRWLVPRVGLGGKAAPCPAADGAREGGGSDPALRGPGLPGL